jgi:hypothetical protein
MSTQMYSHLALSWEFQNARKSHGGRLRLCGEWSITFQCLERSVSWTVVITRGQTLRSMLAPLMSMPGCFLLIRVINLRRKKFWTICLGFTPTLPPETKLSGAWAHSGAQKKSFILAHHRKVKKKKTFKHIFFFGLAPTQVHTHAYSLVGIYFERTGYEHKWHKLHFTQQQRTDNYGLVFKYCIFHEIIARYNKFRKLQNFRTFCHLEWVFILFHTGKMKWGQTEKIWRVGNLALDRHI